MFAFVLVALAALATATSPVPSTLTIRRLAERPPSEGPVDIAPFATVSWEVHPLLQRSCDGQRLEAGGRAASLVLRTKRVHVDPKDFVSHNGSGPRASRGLAIYPSEKHAPDGIDLDELVGFEATFEGHTVQVPKPAMPRWFYTDSGADICTTRVYVVREPVPRLVVMLNGGDGGGSYTALLVVDAEGLEAIWATTGPRKLVAMCADPSQRASTCTKPHRLTPRAPKVPEYAVVEWKPGCARSDRSFRRRYDAAHLSRVAAQRVLSIRISILEDCRVDIRALDRNRDSYSIVGQLVNDTTIMGFGWGAKLTPHQHDARDALMLEWTSPVELHNRKSGERVVLKPGTADDRFRLF